MKYLSLILLGSALKSPIKTMFSYVFIDISNKFDISSRKYYKHCFDKLKLLTISVSLNLTLLGLPVYQEQ